MNYLILLTVVLAVTFGAWWFWPRMYETQYDTVLMGKMPAFSKPGASLAECQQACTENEKCMGMSWLPEEHSGTGSSQCAGLASIYGDREDEGWVSKVKRPQN